MLITIVVLFFLCWLPLNTYIMIVDNKWYSQNDTFSENYVAIFFVSHILAMGKIYIYKF